MYKALLVDDELLVRTNLKLMLDWRQHGFALCGEAANGAEALEIVERENPDLVVSDLRMPVMDGLQLSDELARRFPRCRMVMLSNYDDFDYVKGTLRNGAVDYLLKHRLNPEELGATLFRVKDVLDARPWQAGGERPDANQFLALRTRFIAQLIAGFHYSPEEFEHHVQTLNLKLDPRHLVPVILSIDNYRARQSRATLKATELERFSILNIVEEILGELGNGAVCHIGGDRFAILISFPGLRSESAVDRSVGDAISRIAGCLRTFLNLSASFSIGPSCPTPTHIPQGYAQAEKQLQDRFHLGKSVVLRSASFVKDSGSFAGLEIETEKSMTSCLRTRDSAGLFAVLDDLFARIKAAALSMNGCQLLFNDLLSLLHRAFREIRSDLSMLYADAVPPHERLAAFETLEEVKGWFHSLFARYFDLARADENGSYSDYTVQAIRYIRSHLSDNISLTQVADRIGISGAYLSTLFKNEVNIGFAEYLSDARLDRAKSYLEDGREDLKDIAALCGFNSTSYFFKTFKKKTGMTPSEFARGPRSS
ncbi:response regulator [Cohnella fermenti]|uniref:Response regulator n=1 Tax=Cohnella fermenti TaxID=2565925 RepID=A0A4S4BUW8_9BACL|nr:response regulator [Cohnella fermenti]THF76744.1 response regulator [Cohnella fermenti]